MRKTIICLALLVGIGLIFSRYGQFDRIEFYVLLPGPQGARFSSDLGKVAELEGLVPNPGQVTDDRGITTHVVDASSTWFRFWSANALLGGHEDARLCGISDGRPRSDLGQFEIDVESALPFRAGAVKKLADAIAAGLRRQGYDVRAKREICSTSAKHN